MNKNPLSYFREHKNVLIISFILLLLILASIIFINYNSKENKIKRYLKDASKELVEITLTLPAGIKDLTIDTTITKNILSKGIENLNNLLQSISNVEEVSPNISTTKANLTAAVNSTISLFNYSLQTLSNPTNIKSVDDLNKFDTLRDDCITNYSNLALNRIYVNFSKETITFLNNFSSYMNTLIKINRDSQFIDSQKRNFVNILQGYKSDISYLNEDLTIAINKIREDKRDLNVIIDDLYEKEEIYNKLKDNLTLISIPEGCMDIYESLNEYLNSYSAYLLSIKDAVIYEKTVKNLDDASKEIASKYKNSNSKREDALSAYSVYEKKLTKF
ncbi:MAG: hypothetical protein HUJ77_07385 [Clostridium sp.]|uniref:hypothetical protein n=1 Tax=Clostridium sp. TaxID=1506 RepID=UPI0025C0802C|nr:hypothetical protein [Clostridium sp.]MCF0148205.1 hypothetical protein [Clostridium sp.]